MDIKELQYLNSIIEHRLDPILDERFGASELLVALETNKVPIKLEAKAIWITDPPTACISYENAMLIQIYRSIDGLPGEQLSALKKLILLCEAKKSILEKMHEFGNKDEYTGKYEGFTMVRKQ